MKRWYAVWIVAAASTAAHACPVCYGAADDPQTAALNYAIITLLTVTGCVLGGVAAFLVILLKREAHADALVAPRREESAAVEAFEEVVLK